MTMGADNQPFARGLSELWADWRDDACFDVLIVGSGYGGSVAAAGLAGCKDKAGRPLRIGVLERGKHYRPGEFPARFADLPGHIRLARQASGVVHGPEGLLDVRVGDDVMALVANGLGGGSLINAGVLLKPDLGDFAGADWKTWRDLLAVLENDKYFERALLELGGKVVRNEKPVDNTIALHADVRQGGPLRKTAALERLCGAVDPKRKVKLPPITVAMEDGANQAGVLLKACTLCGDCMTGCNVGAKDSLDANLLVKARREGAEIYTGATVVSIALEGNDKLPRWRLRVAHTNPALQAREKELLHLRAHHVVLAAGSLGSSEILLRSRGENLCFSARLGEGFSCNGDNIAAVHRMPDKVNGSADEDKSGKRHVGPTITATFTLEPGKARSPQVQEFAVPAPLKRIFDEAVTTAGALNTLPKADWTRHRLEDNGELDPLAVNDEHMNHTLLVGTIGHDDAAGALRLPRPVRPREGPAQTGVVAIHWPGARDAEALEGPHRKLQALVAGLKRPAMLIANPLWRLLPRALERLIAQPRGPVLTVHPLGGCGIGDKADKGVVDQEGCVFDAGAAGWQGSLLVLDGAMIPGSLGVNPALTITALAMRAVDALRVREGWQGGTDFSQQPAVPPAPVAVARARVDPPASAPEPPPPATQVEVIERLTGEALLDVGERESRRCMVELTLAYKPVPVRELMGQLERTVPVDGRSRHTRLRIYDFEEWRGDHLRVASDAQRAPFVRFEATLTGHLRFLHRDASGPLGRVSSALWAWLRNRGMRDTWQEAAAWLAQWFDRRERARRRVQRSETKLSYLRALIGVATHAGEVRLFDYELKIDKVSPTKKRLFAGDQTTFEGAAVVGDKRLTYNRRANPWQQLTQLTLKSLPGLRRGKTPMLTLDPGFMAGVGVPLLRLASQRDHASALAELASFALQLVRVLIYTHLWTFRKPDAPGTAPASRLPGIVQGVVPEVIPLVVDRVRGSDEPITIRLSRYQPPRRDDRPANPHDKRPPALVMIHGYSVSGNTFTHETLQPSAAGYFLDRGRDVWVVDLRTSAGLESATEPWAFEQAALIDLPAALLHIKSVTGGKVDVLAHCIGCAMLGMAILSDAREIASNEQQLGVSTWLTNEHLGLLSAFNGVRPDGGPHPTIERVVLSQKGPVLRYTDANILRAFLMQSIRRLLLSDDFQFRPPERPTLSDELLDRVLSSLPYPKADYDVENPLWPCATTPWTTTRHRMDALYGRDFDAANMHPETLEAIDDLFGPINLDTVAQTTHFARFCLITNQAGRGEFVTRKRLHDRWGGIPTLAIHGNDNGLADVDTQRLLERHLQGARVRLEALPAYKHMGHQDVLIGKQSRRVFDDIHGFFTGPPPELKPDELPPLVFDAPWVGPRIELPRRDSDPLRLAAMPRPDQGRARLGLVPARRHAPGKPRRYEPIDMPAGVSVGDYGASGQWLFAPPRLDALAGADRRAFGFFALLVYDADDTTAFGSPGWPDVPVQPPAQSGRSGAARAAAPGPSPAQPAAVLPPAQFQDEIDEALDAAAPAPDTPAQPTLLLPWPALLPLPAAAQRQLALAKPVLEGALEWLRAQSDDVLARCFVMLDDLRRVEDKRKAAAPQPDFAFVLGSCQYPHGLLDRGVANASLARLQHSLDQTQLALFVGDQIYADATAGLLDATRSDERYDAPHDRALRVPGMRALLRRVPLLTLPDDHELADNWEPLAPAVPETRPQALREREDARMNGLRAFYNFQRMQARAAADDSEPPPADLRFVFGGHPFYLLDTRSCRRPRSAAAPGDIIEPAQWERLEQWLAEQGRDAVKFVATSALLLPRHRAVADDPRQAFACDSWCGYPWSLHRLLNFIAANDIRHAVFLSGDEHHALYSEAWLGPQRVKLVSVHSSALYAPFPFANGRPQDLVEHETIPALPPFAAEAEVHTTFAPPGDGFARVQVIDGKPPALSITFHKADGRRCEPYSVALG